MPLTSPVSQSMHDELAVLCWNLPDGHDVHEATLPTEYVPARQLVHDVDPSAEYVPGGHALHCIDGSVEYVPAAHAIHLAIYEDEQ